MVQKIEIPEEKLINLYLKQKLSTYKIAKKFNCDSTVIQKRLREHNIKLRNPKKKINLSREKLYDLYIGKRFSTQKISKILGISSCTVYYKLKEQGIQPRAKKIIKTNKKELRKLYIGDKLSCSEIAKRLGCSNATVFGKLKKHSIKIRSLSESNIIYPKKKFNENKELKAYMIGFRIGDLNVKAINENATIFIKSGTTKKEQYELIKNVYGIYGHCKVNFNKGVYQIYCNLDKSFSFLLQKQDKIEGWILKNNEYFLAFLGGYTDAEGSFGVSQGKARFRLGSYDKNILKQIYYKLNSFGIITKFNLERKAIKGKQNQDFYRISVNEKASLLKLVNLIKPHIKHKKRYNDILISEKNILERNKKYKNNISL